MIKLRVIGFVLFLFGFSTSVYGADLVIEMLDVGQADGFLLQTQGKTVLIDAGEQPQQVKEYLEERGISRLDMVVGTHPHADHIGGMEAVLRNFDVGVYLDNGFAHTTSMYEKVMTVAEEKVNQGRMKYRVARQGQRINFGTEAYFEVLLPREVPITGTRSDINSNSIILKLTHGSNCILFMGDAEAETEEAILDIVGTCQVLKASHHGSRHSSIDALLDTVKPQVALISCGLANKHGHPGAEMMQRLALRNIKDYRTDLSGAIKATSDGKTWRFEEEHPPLQISKININLAGEEVLRELPGVGKKTAQSIIAYREANGYFTNVNDVLLVAGGNSNNEKRLQKIIPFIVTEGGSTTGLVGSVTGETSGSPYLVVEAGAKTSLVLDLQAFTGMSYREMDAALSETMAAYDACGGVMDLRGISRVQYEKRSAVCGAMNNSQNSTSKFVTKRVGAQPSSSLRARVGDKVNINSANEVELSQLPGMSASKARSLIAHRMANGPFSSCERIVDVKGIGQKTFEKLAASCVVTDGTLAPIAAAPQGTPRVPQSINSANSAGKVNINTATFEELRELPGMSATKAQKMVEDRSANGFFKSCQEVTRVKGIGQKTVDKFLPQCSVQ